jgi:hypothetical protein
MSIGKSGERGWYAESARLRHDAPAGEPHYTGRFQNSRAVYKAPVRLDHRHAAGMAVGACLFGTDADRHCDAARGVQGRLERASARLRADAAGDRERLLRIRVSALPELR